MNNDKQQLLIEYLVSSPDTFAICQGIIKAEYFDPEFRNSVSFIKNYYSEYNTTPTTSQVKAETGVTLEKQTVTPDQIQYTTEEIEKFCQRRAFEKVILSSPKKISEGKFEEVLKEGREAILISLQRDLGLRYFENPEQRLNKMLVDNPVIPTGWAEVDDLLFGGISKKELLLVSANSGGGKSITLSNLAFNVVHQGYNVVYLSLELSPEIIGQRFDTMFTGISRKVWKNHVSEIATSVKAAGEQENMGVLDIIQMKSGTTANQIRSFLKEYFLHYGFMPDLLIIDYLDKMNANEKVDLSDVWTKDKLCAEQARDIGVEYDIAIATASQLNRDAVKATKHDHSHIAGGISKINESDVYWSIMLTDSMKAAGTCSFSFQKTRNSDGVGKTVYLTWEGKFLRILDGESGKTKLTFVRKQSDDLVTTDRPDKGNNSILDLMSSI